MKNLFLLAIGGAALYFLSQKTPEAPIVTTPVAQEPIDNEAFYTLEILLQDDLGLAPNLNEYTAPLEADFAYTGNIEGDSTWFLYDLYTDNAFDGLDWGAVVATVLNSGLAIKKVVIKKDDILVVSVSGSVTEREWKYVK